MQNRRTFAALLTASLATALVALPDVAEAATPLEHSTHKVANRGYAPASTASYSRWAEGRLANSHARVADRLRRTRLTPAQKAQIMYDVDRGASLIRARIQLLGKDGSMSYQDTAQIHGLADAIRRDLGRHYGRIDSWRLL